MKKPLIAVIDYGMGNLRSVGKALEKAGASVQVTDSPRVIRTAQGVVLPGVGAFGDASKRLAQTGLAKAVTQTLERGVPFLGICLGLQLLFERSEESRGVKGLGFWKGTVRRFSAMKKLKVPHMGWNTLNVVGDGRTILKGLKPVDYFYFVHSYYPVPEEPRVIATTTTYGAAFCSSAAEGRVFASQFHPEKSGAQGQRLLRNFITEVAACS